MKRHLSTKILMMTFIVSVGCVLFRSGEADAAATLRFCAEWKANFSDASDCGANQEEDYYCGTGNVNRSAQYTEVGIWKKNGSLWSLVITDHLNTLVGDYMCTSPITVLPNEYYRFDQTERLNRGNRTISIVESTVNFNYPTVDSIDYLYTIPSYWTSGEHILKPPTTIVTRQTSVTAASWLFLNRAITLNYPDSSSEDILIYTDTPDCPGSAYQGRHPISNKNVVCFNGTDASISKFVLTHELGHALTGMDGDSTLRTSRGPSNTTYKLDCDPIEDTDTECLGYFKPADAKCLYTNKPTDPPGGNNTSHHMQSREAIGSAQGEGFAHFIATATFNSRDNTPAFNYYKWVNYPPDPANPAVWDTVPGPWLYWNEQRKWMPSWCQPGANLIRGFGTEWDWATFFWETWAGGTTGTTNFEVSEIFNVFDYTARTDRCCPVLNCTDTDSNGISEGCDNPPANACSQSVPAGGCGAGTRRVNFGWMWGDASTGLVATMNSQQSLQLKRNHFTNMGSNTGVTY
jgi:hypothetical protein